MFELLSQIRFTNPGAAALVPAVVGFLIYAYFRKGRGKKSFVPTLFLFQQLQTTSSSRSKFLPPLYFFTELILVLLLLMLLAGMSITKDEKRVAILLDDSFSMHASSQTVADGRTALEAAKRELEPVLATLGTWDKVDLVLASSSENPPTLSVGEATARIRSAVPRFVSDRIESRIENLLSKSDYSQIYVATDKDVRIENSPSTTRERLKILSVQNIVRDNVALSELRTEPSKSDPTLVDGVVTVSNFGESELEILIQLDRVNPQNDQMLTKVRASKEAVSQGESREVRFPNLPLTNLYRVQIELIDPGERVLHDSISQDNVAWLVPEKGSREVRFVGELSPEELQLNHLDMYEFTRQSVDSSFTIFHRELDETFGQSNALVIMPPIGSELFPRKSLMPNPKVTRWMESHPLTAYLNLSLLQLKIAAPLEPIAWANEVINTDQGAVLYAGRKDGKKFVVTGFELFPFTGRQSPVLSILTLNIFKWLSGEDLQQNYVAPYSSIEGSSPATNVRSIIAAKWSSKHSYATSPGIVFVDGGVSGGSYRAINFFEAGESSLLSPSTIIDGGIDVRSAVKRTDEDTASRTLLLLILLILALNLCLLLREFRTTKRLNKGGVA